MKNHKIGQERALGVVVADLSKKCLFLRGLAPTPNSRVLSDLDPMWPLARQLRPLQLRPRQLRPRPMEVGVCGGGVVKSGCEVKPAPPAGDPSPVPGSDGCSAFCVGTGRRGNPTHAQRQNATLHNDITR